MPAAKTVKKPARRKAPARTVRKPARQAAASAFASSQPSTAVSKLPTIEATQLRANLSRALSRVGHGHERVAVSRNGAVDVVMLPREDFERFAWLEDYLDGVDGMRALEAFKQSREKSIPSADVLKRLGIK